MLLLVFPKLPRPVDAFLPLAPLGGLIEMLLEQLLRGFEFSLFYKMGLLALTFSYFDWFETFIKFLSMLRRPRSLIYSWRECGAYIYFFCVCTTLIGPLPPTLPTCEDRSLGIVFLGLLLSYCWAAPCMVFGIKALLFLRPPSLLYLPIII